MASLPPEAARKLLGTVSLFAGALRVVAPRPMARLYGMPVGDALMRALGLRDMLLGAALHGGLEASRGRTLHALAHVIDAGLIAAELVRQRKRARAQGVLMSTALTLALCARELRERLREPGP